MSLPESLLLICTILGTICVVVALVVTTYIFFRTRQDINEIIGIKNSLTGLRTEKDKTVYISDQLTNVIYDLYELIGSFKAYAELREEGCKIDDGLFEAMNSRISLAEKHFAELGLFSQDEERRRSVQASLVNRYGDMETLRVMREISTGRIGQDDHYLRKSIRSLQARLNEQGVLVRSEAWTGRPSGGSF